MVSAWKLYGVHGEAQRALMATAEKSCEASVKLVRP